MNTQKRTRATVVCLEGRNILTIELQDPTTGKRMWSLPGGEIEENETPERAAVRETLEETGHLVVLHPTARMVTEYLFRWNAILYECTTHWFVATPSHHETTPVEDADYLLGSSWLPIRRINELFAYHPHIREVTKQLIKISET